MKIYTHRRAGWSWQLAWRWRTRAGRQWPATTGNSWPCSAAPSRGRPPYIRAGYRHRWLLWQSTATACSSAAQWQVLRLRPAGTHSRTKCWTTAGPGLVAGWSLPPQRSQQSVTAPLTTVHNTRSKTTMNQFIQSQMCRVFLMRPSYRPCYASVCPSVRHVSFFEVLTWVLLYRILSL